jgi:hypothetical protein
MEPYGPDHALAARARALDNRRPHVYVNRTGEEAGKRFVGASCAVDAGGGLVTCLGPDPERRCFDLDLSPPVGDEVDYLYLVRGLPVTSGQVRDAADRGGDGLAPVAGDRERLGESGRRLRPEP